MAEKTTLEQAIDQLRGNEAKYRKPIRYYDGDHDLRFATDKFTTAFGELFKTFALNLCPAICDAVNDKLIITGFKVEEGNGELPTEAWQIWQKNSMGARSGEIHKEAVKTGDAYAIVWPDAAGSPTIFPNRAELLTAKYSDENPGQIEWAAKYWVTSDKRFRLNLYFPDRIEQYQTAQREATLAQVPEAKRFTRGEDIPNPFDEVPVFHFANQGAIGSFGSSELKNAIPIQDALNKTVLDMLVAMEFSAYRQRWVAGIELEENDAGEIINPFKSSADRLWVAGSSETKFGDFNTTDLRQFLEVKDSFRLDLASVTGTPIYYFTQTSGDFPSGEALKRAESRFISKIRDRQETFGNVWERVLSFALKIAGRETADTSLFTDWEEAAPVAEQERLNNLILKQQIGISDRQALTEAGYGEEDIARILAEKTEQAEAAARRFDAGIV